MLQIILTIWIACAIFNLIVISPAFFDNSVHKDAQDRIQKEIPEYKPVSLVTITLAVVLLAPVFVVAILMGKRK